MSRYRRAVWGAEAGAIAAAALELSFFVLDLVRLRPLETPATLSGGGLGPGASAVDLTSLTGVIGGIWSAYQIVVLTFTHFLTFVLVGVLASLLFDWSRPTGIGRAVAVAALCTLAFFATVAASGSLVAVQSVGTTLVVGMNVLAAGVLIFGLRLVSVPPDESPQETEA